MKPINTTSLCQTAAALLTAFLALCTASTSYAANAGAKVAVVSLGLFGGQNVFDREAKGAADIVAKTEPLPSGTR